eukprot:18592-Heterococcus_DN1.PRE.2
MVTQALTTSAASTTVFHSGFVLNRAALPTIIRWRLARVRATFSRCGDTAKPSVSVLQHVSMITSHSAPTQRAYTYMRCIFYMYIMKYNVSGFALRGIPTITYASH